jgi:hypothetical protein
MALDFTTAILDSRVTFTRSGNTATVTNSSGVIVGINANLPRFDFDPTTLICKGLLIEEARANVLLNSLIDGTSLATQLVTVTAAARTFSFYGTGTVVLSGAHSATVVGTGAYPTRTTLTFTPIAGVLTLTVTGTVQFAQLETGSFATSYIPTEALAVTRNADVATMTGANFSDWYNATEGTFAASFSTYTDSSNFRRIVSANANATANEMYIGASSSFSGRSFVTSSSSAQASFNYGAFTVNTPTKIALAYKTDSIAGAMNGGNPSTDALATIPTVNRLEIGVMTFAGLWLNGHIQKIQYWPQRLINTEVQAFSK